MKNSRLQRRGFTLIELMVSLVMGLVVALAAVGLARNATTTFHEQARSSTAQMSLRMASDRLRQDLMRTSYMSTGNIMLDPKVSKTEGTTGAAIARYATLQKMPVILTPLRGIAIDVNMAKTGTIPTPLKNNGLSPDAIYLVGNFKSDEVFAGTITSGGSGGACSGGFGQTINIPASSDAPAYFLSLNASGNMDAAALLKNANLVFMPKPGAPYLAQVTDVNGCTNYVPVCNVTTNLDVNGNVQLNIVIDGSSAVRHPVLMSVNGDGEKVKPGCGADEFGPVTIAPLQMVRWSIQKSETMLDQNDPGIEAPNDKFDLVREMFDFNGTVFQKEVVAEYVVDLKFGIGVDVPGAPGASRQQVYDSEEDTTGNIGKVTADPTSTVGPQRVRSVRYRIASRVAMPDRENGLDLDAGPTLARFCTDFPGCKKWARVRTLNSEVVLSNQLGMTY